MDSIMDDRGLEYGDWEISMGTADDEAIKR
jgi:hypothetical protein